MLAHGCRLTLSYRKSLRQAGLLLLFILLFFGIFLLFSNINIFKLLLFFYLTVLVFWHLLFLLYINGILSFLFSLTALCCILQFLLFFGLAWVKQDFLFLLFFFIVLVITDLKDSFCP